jgi:hypothetical protein
LTLEPDVHFRLGEVTAELTSTSYSDNFVQVGQDGRVLLRVDGVARYLLEDASLVTVEPARNAVAGEVRMFLLGTVLALLCYSRGLLPLHASCAVIKGRACAFVGNSGAGKSTTAAAMVRSGHAILADDVTAIDMRGPVPMVRPSFPRIKLWEDSLTATGFDGALESGGRIGTGKYHLLKPGHFSPEPVPLAAIYELDEGRDERPIFHNKRGTDAVMSLRPHIYRRGLGELLGRRLQIFYQLTQLVACAPYFKASRLRDLTSLHTFVDAIACHSTDQSG